MIQSLSAPASSNPGFELRRRADIEELIRTTERDRSAERTSPSGIRCPLCSWQPRPSSRWACVDCPTPELFFGGCGTVWNTFDTHGVCPRCTHAWQWTSCLACGGWSLHDDWYIDEEGRPSP
jgi:hypothetical protein